MGREQVAIEAGADNAGDGSAETWRMEILGLPGKPAEAHLRDAALTWYDDTDQSGDAVVRLRIERSDGATVEGVVELSPAVTGAVNPGSDNLSPKWRLPRSRSEAI